MPLRKPLRRRMVAQAVRYPDAACPGAGQPVRKPDACAGRAEQHPGRTEPEAAPAPGGAGHRTTTPGPPPPASAARALASERRPRAGERPAARSVLLPGAPQAAPFVVLAWPAVRARCPGLTGPTTWQSRWSASPRRSPPPSVVPPASFRSDLTRRPAVQAARPPAATSDLRGLAHGRPAIPGSPVSDPT